MSQVQGRADISGLVSNLCHICLQMAGSDIEFLTREEVQRADVRDLEKPFQVDYFNSYIDVSDVSDT